MKVSVNELLTMASVPSSLKDEIRQDIVIGLGKDKFDEAEAKSLVPVIQSIISKKIKDRKEKARRRKIKASVVKFKREHKPINLTTCPICRNTLVTVYLANGRVANYCPRHRVVLPLPVEIYPK